MSGGGVKHSELRTLMELALQTCIALQNYSDENFNVLLKEDDEKIAEVIDNREKIIEALIDIEYKIDIILDEVEEYDYGNSLPPDVDELRRSARSVLNEISERDMEVMKHIGSKMQKYKNETLKARNKKNLTAYMRTAFSDEPGDSVDFKK
ncbi:MAG: hypothetical protein GX847_03580 [Clostridiales bacterium]|nr:hypothetical protein [Clostridiales bacterium]